MDARHPDYDPAIYEANAALIAVREILAVQPKKATAWPGSYTMGRYHLANEIRAALRNHGIDPEKE